MLEPLPWLEQGDIFARIPLFEPILADGQIRASFLEGPALLLTHGCSMDKPDREPGQPRLVHLQFVRLRSMRVLSADIQRRLRRRELGPFDALHVGEPPNLPESFVTLNDPFFLPFGYFEPSLQSFPTHPARRDDGLVAVPTINDTRVGRLDNLDVDLLHRKIIASWTRIDARVE